MKKISSAGTYLPYKGISVICPIVQNLHNEFIREIEKKLYRSDAVLKYYCPLPATSYHMTLCNLHTKISLSSLNEKFDELLSDPRLIQTLRYLRQVRFAPTVHIKSIYVRRSLGFEVLFGCNLEEAHFYTNVANGLRDQIMSLFNLVSENYSFHITLGYEFQSGAKNDMEFREIIQAILRPYAGKKIELGVARLSYFANMEAYFPLRFAYLKRKLTRLSKPSTSKLGTSGAENGVKYIIYKTWFLSIPDSRSYYGKVLRKEDVFLGDLEQEVNVYIQFDKLLKTNTVTIEEGDVLLIA